MQEIPADSSPAMFFDPATHLLVGPCPFKGMGIEPIIFRGGILYVVHELLATMPRTTLQVVKAKGAVEQLSLIEPRSMNRCKAPPPPVTPLVKVRFRGSSRMTRIAVLNQVYP